MKENPLKVSKKQNDSGTALSSNSADRYIEKLDTSTFFLYLSINFTKKLGIPLSSYLEITTHCNFRCVHCYLCPSLPKSKKEMTISEVLSVIDQLADLGVLYLHITGGEPLLRPDFWKIIEHAKKREFAIMLHTNGSLITEDMTQRLTDLFLYSVIISIYGMSENIYKSITGASGAFEKVMRNAELLRKKGVNLELPMVLFRENFFQLKEYEKFIKKIGARQSFVWDLHPCLDGSQTPFRHMLTKSQIKEFLYSHPNQREPMLECAPEDLDVLCDGGKVLTVISSTGGVAPCIFLKDYANVPNIRDKSIKEILAKNKFYKRILSFRLQHLPHQCQHCEAMAHCFPCPGRVYLQTGNVLSSAPVATMCKMAWLRKNIIDKFPPA